jgi:CBS domain-containing protein
MKPVPFTLLVQQRRTLLADGTICDEALVRCQRRDDWIAPAECEVCEQCAHVSRSARMVSGHPTVICRHVGAPAKADDVASRLEPSVLCIEGGVTAAAAREVIADEWAPAVVVDRDGHPLGMISAEEIGLAAPEARVIDLARKGVTSLLEGGSVSDAENLGRKLGQPAVPVVRRGRVLGVIVLR